MYNTASLQTFERLPPGSILLLLLWSVIPLLGYRRGHDVLRDQLPAKEEHVILVRLSPIQRALYTEFMKRFREAGNNGWLGLNPLKAFCVCCKVWLFSLSVKANLVVGFSSNYSSKCLNLSRSLFSPLSFQIWNHPDVLYEALQKENQANEQDLDLDDITSAGNPRCPVPGAGLKTKVADASNSKNNIVPAINPSQERANQVITYEWVMLRLQFVQFCGFLLMTRCVLK